jgi:hypothetical protein
MKLPWHEVEAVDARRFGEIRRTAIFECCKWDPQVEDVCALSPQPLVLTAEAWVELVELAERLARETFEAEREILRLKSCWRELGLPWALRRRLGDPAIVEGLARHFRFIRFDFHYTPEGWRISEANGDVPGGFNEASGFTRLIASHYGRVTMPGDPAQALVAAIQSATGAGGMVALVYATAFTDDRQVMVYLARRLEAVGLKPVLVSPEHLRWENGKPFLATDWSEAPVDFIFRFFPTEWLPELPRRSGWWNLLGGSRVPLCNPGSAIVTQSKRFPLVWEQLVSDLPAWKSLLPRTCDPRRVDGSLRGPAVLKSAFGRVGDMIQIAGVTPEKEARLIERAVRKHPQGWIAQERFDAVPFRTATGDVYPCIGVYTLNGQVIGAYGRIARRPLIDHLAQDAAVLIAEPGFAGLRTEIIPHDIN